MIALQYARIGEPVDVVIPTEVTTPQPGRDEVRVRVVRSPIHHHDLATIRGIYSTKPAVPAIGGSELLGIVDALGDGVSSIAIGARVACMTRGAWAEYAIAAAEALVPIPDAIDDDRACQLLAMPLSTLVLFDALHLEPGAWIVQNAANGAVGRLIIRFAHAHGVNVINLVRREDAAEALRAFGAEHVVVTAHEDWPERARAITGGAPIIRAIDSVGGAQTVALQHLLGRGGEYIVFGALAGESLRFDPGAMIFHELVVRGFWMSAWMARASRQQRFEVTAQIIDLALRDALPLSVAATCAFTDAREALAAAEQPGRSGKILLHP